MAVRNFFAHCDLDTKTNPGDRIAATGYHINSWGENIAAGYLDPLLPGGGLAQVFPFIVMIIVLVFRPHGLFGLETIERV